MSPECRNFTMYQINNEYEYEYQDQGYQRPYWTSRN